MTFTHDDFLKAILAATKAQPPDARCFTVPDLATSSGKPESWVRKSCKTAWKAGMLKTVRFTKINDWGNAQSVVGYQLVTNGKRK